MFKYIGLALCLCISLSFANEVQDVVTCPMIALCKPSAGPKNNKAFAKINQAAYDCYRYVGETTLAESAARATTQCMAIYGATTATTVTENAKSTSTK
jgi:hypothetical protein